MKNYIFLFLKGLAMGAVNKIPGVSGGTVAFITGIYEDLINSIKKINFKSFKILFSRGFKDFYFEINGMIIGSFYVIYYQLERLSLKTLIGILVGLASGLLISFADNFEVTNSNLIIFISGMIAISGMILPGLSGSYLLLLMGNYTLIMVDSVNALYFTITEIFSFNFDFLNDPDRIYLLKILFFFTIGSVAGLIFLSNILSTLLKNYKSLTIAVIVGFIAGSLRGVWPWKSEGVDGKISLFFPNFSLGETHLTLVYIFIGILFVVLLERFANKN